MIVRTCSIPLKYTCMYTCVCVCVIMLHTLPLLACSLVEATVKKAREKDSAGDVAGIAV